MWKESKIGKIPQDWNVTELGEICKYLTDGSHYSPKIETSQFYMASVKDMRYNYFDFEDCKTISENDFNILVQGKCSPKNGDLIISKDGANCLDLIFVYNQPEKIVLLSSIAIASLEVGFDSFFYMYFMLSPKSQYQMKNSFISGTAIPRVVLKDFQKVPVPLIPYPEQCAISSILKSLDSKIDLLNRQNKTLEALTETLFKQWFIEEVDESCEEISLDQIADFLNGLACQKYPPIKDIEKLPVIKIKEMNSGYSDKSDYVTSQVDNKYLVESGDILFSWSGSLELCVWPFEKGVLNQHLFKVTSKNYPKWFYFFVIKYHLPEFRVIAESKSTTMGHIQRHHLTDAKFKKPSKDLLNEKNEIIEPLFSKIILNHTQIRTLTQLRDTLLPKLMSGEVRVEG